MVKNIFIEGLQGAGKSTLTGEVAKRRPDLQVYREGDLCPVELAWCCYMNGEEYGQALTRFPNIAEEIGKWTKQEGERYVMAYTRIITDYPGFHKYMEQYEIYQGRKSLVEFKEIIFSRYRAFGGEGCLFECAFFQNIIEDLILYYQLPDEEILEFYRQLWQQVDQDKFLLIYLESTDVSGNLMQIRRERVDAQGNEMWYPLMIEYLKESPKGRAVGYQDFVDLVSHLEHRQCLELRICREILGEHVMILPSKKWLDFGGGTDR